MLPLFEVAVGHRGFQSAGRSAMFAGLVMVAFAATK
jgi:hypothetical protein